MSDTVASLNERLAAKNAEILALIKKSGLTENDFEPIVETFDEAMNEPDTAVDAHALDARLASSAIGALLLERYEIEQRLLDILDDDAAGE